MSAALELVRAVEANGGQIRVEDGCLVIAPGEAAEPVMAELRLHKAEIIALLSSRPIDQAPPLDEPDAWRGPFRQWMTEQCVSKDRCFGGIGRLLIHFAEWSIANDSVPCTRPTFETLLTEAGFLQADGFVSGLFLAEDWGAARCKPSTKQTRTRSGICSAR